MAERPWKATPEQEECEGDWADYAAWESWLTSRMPDDSDLLGEIGAIDAAHLYCAMCDLADGTPEPIHAGS